MHVEWCMATTTDDREAQLAHCRSELDGFFNEMDRKNLKFTDEEINIEIKKYREEKRKTRANMY